MIGLRVFAERAGRAFYPCIRVWVGSGDERYVGKPLTMELAPEAQSVPPTFEIDLPAAQDLMDQLWTCGLRPSEGTGSAGALAAAERHLKDLQRIVFKDFPPAVPS